MPVADAGRGGSSRSFPTVLVVLAFVLLAARVIASLWQDQHPAAEQDLVHWVAVEDAEAQAVAQGKPVLYDFSADWCGPCQVMKREVFADAERAKAIDRLFVPVRVVDRQQETGRNTPRVDSLQRAFGVDGFPTLVAHWPGATRWEKTSGYLGAPGTMQWLARSAAMARLGGTPGH